MSSSSSKASAGNNDNDIKLLHPMLHQIPVLIRFIISGVTGNLIFLVAYNTTLSMVKGYPASTIFAVVQFFCIILNHWLNVSIVFGWPANYLGSLMANTPVGLSSLALGTFTTGYLEGVEFDLWLAEQVWFLNPEEAVVGGLATSIFVMALTGVYNYVALNIVNASSGSKKTSDDKKEL